MNYFEFYNLPVHYNMDQKKLRRLFLQKSKEFHPDYYGMEAAEDQAAMLEKSSLNNEAYKVLKDDQNRLKYILELKEMIGEEAKNSLPQSFLMEMMEINEQLMDLQFDYDAQQHEALLIEIDSKEADFKATANTVLEQYCEPESSPDNLAIMLNFYLKSRYLRRLRKNMEKLHQN